MIALKNWNRTKPVDKNGKTAGEAVEVPAVGNTPINDDGSITFHAPVDGAHTSGSKYPRDELRELIKGKKAAWKLSQGGTMTATLTVDAVPTQKGGAPGKIVIGQIHGKKDELCRLYWNAGVVNFHNDISGKDRKEHEFPLKNGVGEICKIPLGVQFSYKIEARNDTLLVDAYTKDGQTYSATIHPLDKKWASDSLYFKAGVYLGNNAKQGAKGYGQVTFTALSVVH